MNEMRKYNMSINPKTDRGEQIGRHGVALRAGLSVLEFVGCVIAVVGGLWLGAIYLGVDLHRVAHEALTDTELLEKVPENWRPVAPAEEHMTREQLVTTLREELSGLRTEITTLREGNKAEDDRPGEQAKAAPSGGSKASQQDSNEKTLAYWNRLIEIASGEAALQADAATAFNDANAAKVFAIKSRISRFAAKAVEAVPQEGVDRSVVQFGRQLGVWYERGGELYDKAVHIWESTSAGSQSRTQLNEEWGRAELQHRNETRLLDEKASAVRSAVSRRFGQDFPEFDRSQGEPARNAEADGRAG
jgi:hypothetical protein